MGTKSLQADKKISKNSSKSSISQKSLKVAIRKSITLNSGNYSNKIPIARSLTVRPSPPSQEEKPRPRRWSFNEALLQSRLVKDKKTQKKVSKGYSKSLSIKRGVIKSLPDLVSKAKEEAPPIKVKTKPSRSSIRRYAFNRGLDELMPRSSKLYTSDDLDRLCTLGKGSYGKVFLAREKVGRRLVAVKIFEKAKVRKEEAEEDVLNEIDVQLDLDHPHVLKLLGFFHDDTVVGLVLEYVDGGNLSSFIKREGIVEDQKAAEILAQLVNGLKYLHENNIIHRDIKPANVLIDIAGDVKICDFGLAVKTKGKEDKLAEFCGTPKYIAPEVMKGESYDERVDIWSLGKVFYKMLVGSGPFYRPEGSDYADIIDSQFNVPMFVNSSARMLIHSMLRDKPRFRISLDEVPSSAFLKQYHL